MPDRSNVTTPRLWLASQSPRRAQLMESLGLRFQVSVSHSEEADFFGGSVEATVSENARRKGEAVLAKSAKADDIVIAADTLVALGEEILSKPADEKAAREGIRRLSGSSHRVLTGLALLSTKYGKRTTCVESKVVFRKLSDTEIREYVQTKEPYDKAGGYGIQGLACLFVERVEGSYSNIMGLPTEVLLRELAEITGISPFRWTTT